MQEYQDTTVSRLYACVKKQALGCCAFLTRDTSLGMEPKVERRISLASVNCPFCGTDKTLMASEEFENIGTGETEGVSIDYWDCSGCGYEIPILPEGMEREFKPLEKALGKGKEG